MIQGFVWNLLSLLLQNFLNFYQASHKFSQSSLVPLYKCQKFEDLTIFVSILS